MLSRKNTILILSLGLTANCYAQKVLKIPITLNLVNANQVTVNKEIERLTGITFWGKTEADFLVSLLQVRNMPLEKVLDTIFNTRGYTWTLRNKSIAIRKKEYILTGRVQNRKKEPVVSATIKIEETSQFTSANDHGDFSIKPKLKKFTLIITSVGYNGKRKRINGDTIVTITLDPNITNLAGVLVNAPVPTPQKQNLPPVKDTLPPSVPNVKTGSLSTINTTQYNIPPLQNITDAFPFLTGALLTNPGFMSGPNQSFLNIRSRITINGYPGPLILVNGIPYQGDIDNLNPNDVESFTLVKDAAASTQLGLHSGNGVLMITTKSGSYNSKTKFTATANLAMGIKPNLSKLPYMSAADHIELTKALYESGYYDNQLKFSPWLPYSPVLEILYKQKMGLISASEAQNALGTLSTRDFRKEVQKHLYQASVRQQYHVGVQGGSKIYRFNFSQGYDVDKGNLRGNSNNRFTMYLNHAIKTGEKGLEIYNIVNYTQKTISNNGIDQSNIQDPYIKLADNQGNALAINNTLNQSYKDSINRTGKLLNWDYKPLEEIKLRNNQTTNTAIHITLGINYNFLKKLNINAAFRNETELLENINQHSLQSYYTRNLINTFTQFDSNGVIYRPVPLGAIIDRNIFKRNVNNITTQLKYDIVNNALYSLAFHAGTEIRHLKYTYTSQRDYGVTNNFTNAMVEYDTYFSALYDPATSNVIPKVNDRKYTNEHYYALFANGVFTWKKQLTTSISFRKDESNIFGVQANQKKVPLIAMGMSWDVNIKPNRLLSSLQLKLSNGLCSNASKSVSALTGLQTVGLNAWNAPFSTIINPPNPWLSWETVRISNIGVDFSLFNNHVWGNAEYFVKQGNNLLGMKPNDPTSGISVFQGNVGAMSGHGLELTLHTQIGSKKFQWQSTLLASYVRDRVTRYPIQQPAIWYYCDGRYITPVPGKPLLSIYSFPLKGLDSTNGDPIGLLANQNTKDYNAIIQSPNLNDLIYHGSATPTFYGSFRNTIAWKNFEAGFNIIWKAGYYFRASSINYSAVIKGEAIGHSDIANRWQQPGDELYTKIPSLKIPADNSRDIFYSYSSALVERGDHIRLQNVYLKYHFKKRALTEFNLNATNLGLLWRANNRGIDPDYVNGLPLPLQITIGTKIEL